jgi:outer membrane lipoprotein-sorting protein
MLVLLILCFSSQQTNAVTPQEILKKVENIYADIKSYKDSGTVNLRLDKQEFETYYIKPNLFLFKWVNYKNRIHLKQLKTNGFRILMHF